MTRYGSHGLFDHLFWESFFTIQTNAQAATGTGQEKSSRAPSGLVQEMTMKSQDIDQMKDAMRAPWIAGNFGAIAKTIGALPLARRGERVGHDASSAGGSLRAGS
jgi:hypothetical protein